MIVFVALIFHRLCFVGSTVLNHNDNGDTALGSFWQIADIHYDANYSSPLIEPNLCQVLDGFRNSSTGKAGGIFGDYQCDPPWALVVSSVEAMKSLSPEPDFILWTGDSIPHISDSLTNLDKVYSVIHNVTKLLVETFPKTSIYSMLGNHDVWPAHQIPVSGSFYDDMLSKAGWTMTLGAAEQQTFRKGGYFSKVLQRGLRLVCLNSNLWYTADQLSKNETDPADQFHWLELEMQSALKQSEKVILAGHVPPGIMGRGSVNFFWMYPMFSNRLQWLMQRYGGIISAAIFGHEHTDGFRIVYDNGKPTVPLFMAPAVTPWNSTLPGLGANNPGIRLYHYNRSTGLIKDYTQYYLNLSDANTRKKAHWDVEYRAQRAYSLNGDLSAASLDALVLKFKENGSELFQRFYDFNSVSLDRSPCTGECKRRHICSMTNIDIKDYNNCMRSSDASAIQPTDASTGYENAHHWSLSPDHYPHHWTTTAHDRHHHHEIREFTYYLLGGVLILLVILFFVVAFCCYRRRHAVVLLGRSRYALIQEA